VVVGIFRVDRVPVFVAIVVLVVKHLHVFLFTTHKLLRCYVRLVFRRELISIGAKIANKSKCAVEREFVWKNQMFRQLLTNYIN